jgi:hypothetical protein
MPIIIVANREGKVINNSGCLINRIYLLVFLCFFSKKHGFWGVVTVEDGKFMLLKKHRKYGHMQ